MTIEKYLAFRKKGLSLKDIQKKHCLSGATVYTLELGYQCYLRNISLDKAIDVIKNHPNA